MSQNNRLFMTAAWDPERSFVRMRILKPQLRELVEMGHVEEGDGIIRVLESGILLCPPGAYRVVSIEGDAITALLAKQDMAEARSWPP
jgi:hypothetical protein